MNIEQNIKERSRRRIRYVTVYTTDKEYGHFIELAKNLHYVKKIETDEKPNILDNIKAGLEEAFEDVRLHEQGKKKLKSVKELLNEL
jgi:uncharacterized protein YlbG (UPF0298 family)